MELGQIIIVSMVTFLVVVATVAAVRKYFVKYNERHHHYH